jgi:energy-coupling factor transporter ATP-binding protein EcfA2
MSFTYDVATRDRIGLLFGVAGPSGSGKTFTALTLAAAVAGPKGKVAVIDTENRRARHYADRFTFFHVPFEPPFTPERYIEAVRFADGIEGVEAILIDSMSHEWNGEGGCADIQAAIAEKMATDRNGVLQEWKIDAMTGPAWKKPKLRHKRMMSRLGQTRSHLIFSIRAEQKVEFVKRVIDGKERTEIVQKGFMPICEKEFMFEMSGSFMLHPDTPGVPRLDMPRKLNQDLLEIFGNGQPVTSAHGEALRAWAERGEDRRKPADKSTIAAEALIERFEDAEDAKAVLAIVDDPKVRTQRDWLREKRPELSAKVEAACAAAYSRHMQPADADDEPAMDEAA